MKFSYEKATVFRTASIVIEAEDKPQSDQLAAAARELRKTSSSRIWLEPSKSNPKFLVLTIDVI